MEMNPYIFDTTILLPDAAVVVAKLSTLLSKRTTNETNLKAVLMYSNEFPNEDCSGRINKGSECHGVKFTNSNQIDYGCRYIFGTKPTVPCRPRDHSKTYRPVLELCYQQSTV